MYRPPQVNPRHEIGVMQANHLTVYGAIDIAGHGVCAVQPGKNQHRLAHIAQ
jgi:hypothetical protein